MARILMRRGQGLKTPQLGRQISKFSAEARRPVFRKFGGVRRLIARDPQRAMTQNEVFDQFTNNPNPLYRPGGDVPAASSIAGPGKQAKVVEVPDPPKGTSAGAGRKEIRNQTKPTTLKRR